MTASVEVRFDWSLADGSPLPDGMGVMMYPGVSPDYFRFDMPPEGAGDIAERQHLLGDIVQQ